MSTDQPTLDAVEWLAPHELALQGEGAAYGRSVGSTESPASPETGVCRTCGHGISPQMARVIGDNDGNIEVCHHCYVGPGNEPYSCASRAVRRYRGGYGRYKEAYRTEEVEKIE